MPYTPPSQQPSPGGSGQSTPDVTRPRSDDVDHDVFFSSSSSAADAKPGLPRTTSSTSYLSRHRRTPSFSKPVTTTAPAATVDSAVARPSSTTDDVGPAAIPFERRRPPSPAPVTDASIDSIPVSSDDEGTPPRLRGRRLANLAELQAAIREIGRRPDDGVTVSTSTGHLVADPDHLDPDPGRPSAAGSASSPLTPEARRMAHSRSNTEGAILPDPRPSSPSSEEESDETDRPSPQRPNMVRKKSGELVKPALRPTSCRRRPSSMPGTPTYAKAVHFDAHLEHVRHFLQVDRPLAVSAGSSPVETYHADSGYPFDVEDDPRSRRSDDDSSPPRSVRWEMDLANFPAEAVGRRCRPVRVERVRLSPDGKNLVGIVAVANLAFQKSVVARFTLDYWKTTSEVAAEYDVDVRRHLDDGDDRFRFTLKLADLAKLETKTLFFCVRYLVAGQEFWDNNGGINYQVAFFKRPTTTTTSVEPVHGRGPRPVEVVLPRHSRSSSSSSSSITGRPWSMAASFDDFGDGFDGNRGNHDRDRCDWSSFRPTSATMMVVDGSDRSTKTTSLSSSLSASAVRSEVPLPDYPTRRTGHTGQVFGNRYDFGASLSAAIQAASTGASRGVDRPSPSSTGKAIHGSPIDGSVWSSPWSTVTALTSTSPMLSATTPTAMGTNGVHGRTKSPGSTSPTKFSRPESYITEKPPQQSSTYLELIDKYCFVRSGTPRIAGTT